VAIKGVLFDLDGALLKTDTSRIQPGVSEMLANLGARNIAASAMSMSSSGARRAATSSLPIGAFFGQEYGSKGTGKLVAAFCDDNGFEPHEVLTVFDDQYGFREAINGCTAGFHAEWGGGQSKYGFRLEQPHELVEYLDVFFLKKHLWFGRLDASDGDNRAVVLRALIDGSGAGDAMVKSAIYKTLKDRQDVQFANGTSFTSFLMTHLFASAYLEGLFSSHRDQIFWQIYPGSSPQSVPPQIIQTSIARFKVFRSRSSLLNASGLCRFVAAQQSHKARMADNRDAVKFTNQMNSVALTAAFKKSVKDKRVYVIDDFTTKGYSLEAAREIFYAAGARSVYLLSFGKYGTNHVVQTPAPGISIVPTKIGKFKEADFLGRSVPLTIDTRALTEFITSMRLIANTSIRTKLLDPSPDVA
jgi:hypothetical protein